MQGIDTEFFSNAGDIIGNLVDGLANFVSYIPKGFVYLQKVIDVLPIELAGFMMCTITAFAILTVLGRSK